MFTLMVLLLILILVDSGVLHTCGGVQWRRKHNADKDNLGGHDNDRLQINQNWIWKKTNEVYDDDYETIAILTVHGGLKTRLKYNKAFCIL